MTRIMNVRTKRLDICGIAFVNAAITVYSSFQVRMSLSIRATRSIRRIRKKESFGMALSPLNASRIISPSDSRTRVPSSMFHPSDQ